LPAIAALFGAFMPADKSDPDDADAEKLGRRETVNIVRFGRNTTTLK
jgi:hypothetical protein